MKSLLFNKGIKIQDGCQSNSVISAAEFILCYIINYFEKKVSLP